MDLPRYFEGEQQRPATGRGGLLLGINDCFGAPPFNELAMDKHINGVLDNAEKLLAGSAQPRPKRCWPSASQRHRMPGSQVSRANYKEASLLGLEAHPASRVKADDETHGRREKENIIRSTEINLDPVDGYPDNNGVHPNAIGYAQIGMSFYAWMKSWMAEESFTTSAFQLRA